jgi:hypothetical protein
MRENYYENKLRRKIRALGCGAVCLKFVSPGYTGVPDRIILLPGGHVIFVELKQPGKVERERQRYVQSVLRRLGFDVFSAVDSDERIDEVVERCREEMRNAGL